MNLNLPRVRFAKTRARSRCLRAADLLPMGKPLQRGELRVMADFAKGGRAYSNFTSTTDKGPSTPNWLIVRTSKRFAPSRSRQVNSGLVAVHSPWFTRDSKRAKFGVIVLKVARNSSPLRVR